MISSSELEEEIRSIKGKHSGTAKVKWDDEVDVFLINELLSLTPLRDIVIKLFEKYPLRRYNKTDIIKRRRHLL